MADSRHHPQCPRCHGAGFYLKREGRGYYPDGSFGHNEWEDCTCDAADEIERLPQPANVERE